MRSIFAASVLLASAFAFTGCAVETDQAEDGSEIDTSETAGALSTYGKALVGTYETATGASPFDTIVLNKNGTYKTTEVVQCFAAPCPAITDFGKFIGYRPAFGGKVGGLRLISSKTGRATYFRIGLVEANTTFQLNVGGQWFKYGKPAPKCDYTATETKSYTGTSKEICMRIRIGCADGFVPFSDECGCGCEKAPAPACDYSDPTVKWAAKDPQTCMLVKFACEAGSEPFFGDCGCGCKPAAAPTEPYTGEGCERGGCSGQLCNDAGKGMMTTCEYRAEYACYATARCEKQSTGTCGWTKSDALTACLQSPPASAN